MLEPFVEILEENIEELKKGDWHMGIDEAGRGPVLGPMVYACLAWPVKYEQELAKIGFDDSKKLTEKDRELFFEVLKFLNGKLIFYEYDIMTSEFISNNMLAKS